MSTDSYPSVAGVHILDLPYQADKLYEYKIPSFLSGQISIGDIVTVPFGVSSRHQNALVRTLSNSSEYPNLKEITAKSGVSLISGMIGLCDYMKEHFFCSIGEAVRVLAPTYALPYLKKYYSVSEQFVFSTEMSKNERQILEYLRLRREAEIGTLRKKFGLKNSSLLDSMVSKGYLKCETRLAERRTPVDERIVLNEDFRKYSPDKLAALVSGEKQKEILSFLSVSGEDSILSVRTETGASRETIKTLEKNGYISIVRNEIRRDPYSELEGESPLPTLSEEQNKAANALLNLSESGKPACALLYGVTGSGKTSVIGEIIDRVILSGRQVIMLVPEISLTPQAVKIFYNRYKGRVTVLHSGLSDGERYDAWKRIRRGESDLCIGTRSAVFAPFDRLGLIVIDEEQDNSYKSDSSPRYHARDIARYRCAKENAMLLLSSATPSLQSYSKAKEGKYTLVTLKNRYGKAVLPRTVFADMRKEPGVPPIGSELRVAIANTLEKKEQAILFINRRGFNSLLSCPLCGKAIECPHCSVSYTYHLRRKGDRGYLYCHYCGSKTLPPTSCPNCGSGTLRYSGIGTQQVEEEITKYFPEAKVLRLDSDTTASKMSYDRILGDFREGRADILVGTQMVTKGHDFPNVTLVGVINADSVLYSNDYSATEHAFSLFTQVIGRAGRSEKPGMALLQSHCPDHPVLEGVLKGDYEGMYENEIALRRSLAFPPYVNIVVLTSSSTDEGSLHSYVVGLLDRIKKTQTDDIPICVFGPVEPPVYRINGVFRLRIVIKCVLNEATRKYISKIYEQGLNAMGTRVSLSIDVDPSNL